MQTVFLALTAALLLAATASASPIPGVTPLMDQDYRNIFDIYIQAFNKLYRNEVEHASRFEAFRENYDFIRAHNQRFRHGLATFTVGLNEFADLTSDEYRTQILRPFNRSSSNLLGERKPKTLPPTTATSVDWRAKNAVTPVKNQGQCGSCWSFSSAAAIEGAWAISTGKLVDLSEQELMDCSTSYGNNGCNGGLMDYAFQYVIDNGGIDSLADYPYTARDGTCQTTKEQSHKVAKITSFEDVPPSDEAQLLAAAAQQPISVAIEADQKAFQLYKSGVFSAPCGTTLDHGVTLVGFGSEGSIPYWIVKNSWGASWGEQGYIRLARGVSSDGQCGIAMQPSYPVV